MDPDKRLTCGQLLQHPYFDGFSNEFDRERKEQQKHLHREQQKLIQQQVKLQNNAYTTGNKQPNQGVSIESILSLKKNRNFFQHFPNLSRSQDHEGDNTPASDDRAGRNFHLPNICMRIISAIDFSHESFIFFYFHTPIVFARFISKKKFFFQSIIDLFCLFRKHFQV
jgi:hypothetical protein